MCFPAQAATCSIRPVMATVSSTAFVAPATFLARRPRARGALFPPCARHAPSPRAAAVAAAAAALLAASGAGPGRAVLPPVGASAGAAALESVAPGRPVVDLARVFGERQEERLSERLRGFEDDSGVRVRVLTQRDGAVPGAAIKGYFGLDEKSVLVVVDERGGNVLNFNVGRDVQALLPESFWIELGNRYGNKFSVRDVGEDGAVAAVVDAIERCVRSGNVCRAVPGLGRDQFAVCVSTSIIGGAVAGAASRTGGKTFNVAWVGLFSPLWAIFFGSFGLLPVVTREGWASLDTAGILAAFAVTAVATWAWIPTRFGQAGEEKTDADI